MQRRRISRWTDARRQSPQTISRSKDKRMRMSKHCRADGGAEMDDSQETESPDLKQEQEDKDKQEEEEELIEESNATKSPYFTHE